MNCTKGEPCIRCRSGRTDASEMDKACKFESGSLHCVNDPCPNPNHKERNGDC